LNGAVLWLSVAFGGALGASLRFGVSRFFASWLHKPSIDLQGLPWYLIFPWPTLLVNLIGTALLILSLKSTWFKDMPQWFIFFWGVGLCGGLTTFSTFSYESWWLIRVGLTELAVLNIALNLILGLGLWWFWADSIR
jgi:CrcB protein